MCSSVAKSIHTIKNKMSHNTVATCRFVTLTVVVCVCVFLLSSAHHRNGKPVSTATIFCVNLCEKNEYCMLHTSQGL